MKTIKMMLVIFSVAFITSSSYADEHNIYSKDCSHLKKLHKKLMCKMGSGRYDSEISESNTTDESNATDDSTETSELKNKAQTLKEKTESFNEENKTLFDVIKNWGKKKN